MLPIDIDVEMDRIQSRRIPCQIHLEDRWLKFVGYVGNHGAKALKDAGRTLRGVASAITVGKDEGARSTLKKICASTVVPDQGEGVKLNAIFAPKQEVKTLLPEEQESKKRHLSIMAERCVFAVGKFISNFLGLTTSTEEGGHTEKKPTEAGHRRIWISKRKATPKVTAFFAKTAISLGALSVIALTSASVTKAQGVAYENILITTSTLNNPNHYLSPVTNATITVCSGVHTEIPCTPAVTIYSDVAMTVPITPPLTTSPLGNYRFVVAAGTYSVSFTGPGISTSNDVITLGGGTVGAITGTGSPANGNLTQWSSGTSVTNGNISGDCTTTNTLVITCTHLSGTPVMPNGTTATTQALGDTSTDLATDAFVINNGTGTGNGAQPILAISLSNNCPAANTGNCIFTPANTQTFNDCNSTVSSAVINCTGGHFTSADVGKRIWGWASCRAFQNANPTSLIAAATVATIQTFTSATQISMNVNATGQISNTHTGCIIYGNPDDTGAAAVTTLVTNSLSCPRVFFASSNYMFTAPPGFLQIQPAACANLGVINGFSGPGQFGNVLFPAGYEIEGRGRGPTTIFISPGFPETGACTSGSGAACLWIPTGGRWYDLSFTTGGGTNVGPASKHLVEVNGPASIDNITCVNWGSQSGTATDAFFMSGWVRARQLDVSGCGFSGIQIINNAVVVCLQCAVENQGTADIVVGQNSSNTTPSWAEFNLVCIDCNLFPSQNTNGVIGLVSNASFVKLIATNIADNGSSATGLIGYDCATAGGQPCLLDMDSSSINLSGVTSNSAVKCVAQCIVKVRNSAMISGATGHNYSDTSTSVMNDLGSNNWGTGTASISGTLNADGHSVKGTCTGTATSSSTLGLYGTGPNQTTTTCTSTTIGSGFVISGAKTLENLVVTATHAGVSASSGVVTVLKNGSTTTITCTIGTGTGCNDGIHHVSTADGDLISIQFTTQATEVLAGINAIIEWN